jgi:hypothetical protein
MQETLPKPPGLPGGPFSGIFNALSGSGQPNKKIGDLFVLVAQERAVTIAGLTHAKGAAG